MKYVRWFFGLALIPLCTLLGSFIAIGTGNGMVVGFVLGIVFSYLFFSYGPGHKKQQLPTTYTLDHRHDENGGANQSAVEQATLRAREAGNPFPRR